MPGFDNEIMNSQGSDVGVFPNTTSSDNSTEFSRSGSEVTSIVNNVSDTASSDASNTDRVEGSSSGDPYTKYQVGSVTSFSVGMDNDDSDSFKINHSSSGSVTPSTGTNLFAMDDLNGTYTLDSLSNIKTIIGSEIQLQVINNDTTDADSSARAVVRTASSTADAYCLFDVSFGASPGSRSWKVGSNGGNIGAFEFRNFVSGAVAPIDGTLRMSIDQDGNTTFPTTACFLAKLNVTVNNVTGNGTVYTVVYDNEIFDQGSNFDGTSTFTAPLTGRYSFTFGIFSEGLDATTTDQDMIISTSNRDYITNKFDPGDIDVPGTSQLACSMTILADMDAGDTAITLYTVLNGGLTVDVDGDLTDAITYFSGKLEA